MEIVIKIHDIPQNDHERWVLKNGTLLPKGHGRLIDADDVYNALRPYVSFSDLYDVLDEIPTIIETDGGKEDVV